MCQLVLELLHSTQCTVTKRKKYKHPGTDSADQGNKNSFQSEVLLFAGIEPDETKTKCCGYCTPSSLAIAYFAVVLFWTLLWASVVFWDNFWYSKLTRCVDINTRDDTITCFHIDNHSQADCAKISENGLTADVICYALNRKLYTAVGIAFSVSQFIIIGVQIAFTGLLHCCRLTLKGNTSSGKCCKWCTFFVAIAVGITLLVLWSA